MSGVKNDKVASSPLAQEDAPVTTKESILERWLIMPKLLYFMLGNFVYAYHGLMVFIFIEQWKFPYFKYGYATTIIASNFFGSMIWSSWADRTGKYKLIIILTSIIYTAIVCGMALVKFPDNVADITWKYELIAYGGFGLFNFFLSAAFPLLDAQIMGSLAKNPKLSKEQFNNQRMWNAVGHYAATLCSFVLYNKKEPRTAMWYQLAVSIVFVTLVWFGVHDVKPVKHGHGHHGAAAKKKKETDAGISRSPSPALSDASASSDQPIHQVPVENVPPVTLTPAPPSAADELAAEGSQGQKHPVIALLTSPSFIFFMIFIACSGVIRSITSSFQKLIAKATIDACPFITDAIKADPEKLEHARKVNVAIIDFARMSSEILVYMIAKPLRGALGVYWILVLSQIVGILRTVGYGALKTGEWYGYWAAWGLELMKGFSSGLVSSSAIPIASAIAPPGCENTAQGLFSGMYSGLSMALGGLIGGGILHYYFVQDNVTIPDVKNLQMVHTQYMYLFVSAGCSVVTILMMIKFIFVDRVMGVPGLPRKQSLPG